MAKIKVYRKDTGEIVRVPEHWLEHPVLGKPFRKTPSQKTRELEKEAHAEQEAAKAALADKTSTSRADEATDPQPDIDDKKE